MKVFLKPYRTGLIVLDNDRYYPRSPCKGKNWVAKLQKTKEDRRIEGKEIIIFTKSGETAQRAVNLIIGCLNLWDGEARISAGEFEFLAHREDEIEALPLHKKIKFSHCIAIPNLSVACSIAAKASYRLKFIYAISKYNFSVTNCSVSHVDLEPFRSNHISPSRYPDDQVRLCHAIIAAFSVPGELGLEIRASAKKPSIINGRWNPDVKKDIEDRLTKAGINLKETLLWTIRGPKRKIEIERQPVILSKAHWSRGMVRDAELELIDAINYASWLRSFVASHKIKEITQVISPYDVTNVQHLARRLLLESLGFWRYWEKIKKHNKQNNSAMGAAH